MRTLIVENHADTGLMLDKLLRRAGHEVEIATTGADGLRRCEGGAFQLVVCDIGLPDCDGWELLPKLRGRCGTPFAAIALTGYGHAQDVSKSHAVGFDAHLTKPVDFAALMSTIASLRLPG